jgi:hypothetical protein
MNSVGIHGLWRDWPDTGAGMFVLARLTLSLDAEGSFVGRADNAETTDRFSGVIHSGVIDGGI